MSLTQTDTTSLPRPVAAQMATVAIPADAKPFISFVRFEVLTCRQAAVLLTVRSNPGLTIGALAGALNLAKPVVTRAVDKLEIFGLVRRTTDPMDRRLKQVWAQPERKRR